jgi:polygalacturonase
MFLSAIAHLDSIFAIGIGSETSGIRNVLIENCKFVAKTFAVYIKSRPRRGAFIEDIVCRNLMYLAPRRFLRSTF